MRLLLVPVLAALTLASSSQDQPVAVELFEPGLVSTPLDELNAVFSPDGRELYWSINSMQGAPGVGVIVFSRRQGNRWSRPELASFSGQYSDYDPFFSADGQKLYFISVRPKGAATWNPLDFDIWVVDRQGNGWSEPRNIGAPVNSDVPEYYPSLASDGTMYFSTQRPGSRGFDIFRARPDGQGGFLAPENLGDSVSGPANTAEIDNYVAPDQSFIVFASGRPGGVGGQDLYVSFNRNGVWSGARLLPRDINSPAREYTPIGSPDGQYLYFTSMRGWWNAALTRRMPLAEWRDSINSIRNGNGNLYRVPLSRVLELNR